MLKSKDASKAAIKDSKASRPSSDPDKHADKDDDASLNAAVPSDSTKDNASQENSAAAEAENGKPARVLGIRHWSTPDYTRVAIDLEQGVTYESQRIDNPDRIFFDLINTKLDPKLSGKTFDVSDGLLKDIRMAQFKTGRTRVVLDLDQVSEFEASLLSNPPRLIIDIRNTDIRNTDIRSTDIRSKDNQDTHDQIAHDQRAARALLKQAASSAEITDEKTPADRPVQDSVDNADEPSPAAKAAAEKTVRRNTVVVSNGVKKTIVDADDDQPPVKESAVPTVKDSAAKDKNTIARLDSPDVNPEKPDPEKSDPVKLDLEKTKPASTIPSSPSTSDTKTNTARKKRKTPTADPDVREAQPTASGERSLTRALGLKIGKIVIDPGHGGHDTGTIGPNGLEEKDLVLEVSRRLGMLLQTRLGAEVVFTRQDDTFIPLETRTAIANQEGADLFVSVHANSSHDPDARGVETYYLNFTSSPDALEVAARENAVSEESIHELQDLVKKIALKEKIDESQEFASDVQNSLHSGLAAKNPGVRDRGVKKAPFIVLIGANMPSILAEISFVSNPGDERRLATSEYRQKIAESLYRGIAKYVSGLSGVKVASKIDKQ
jgi:N-acetylmuramoyl-L-alanine amidase